MKTTLTKEDLADLLLAVSDAMIESKEKLGELDSVVGDGDLGVTVFLGFNAVKKSVNEGNYHDIQGLLQVCGMAFADNAASTFGALISTMFLRAGRVVKGKTKIEVADAASMLQAAVEGVQHRGKAKQGDKTMLDALIPASQALTKAASKGLSLPECMNAALKEAKIGAETAIMLKSRAGRSEWMGDRTIGVRDAGAEAMVILLETATNYISK
jgi:dihydroxyacetone kinase-like protein